MFTYHIVLELFILLTSCVIPVQIFHIVVIGLRRADRDVLLYRLRW